MKVQVFICSLYYLSVAIKTIFSIILEFNFSL